MQTLNYCRQMVKQLRDVIKAQSYSGDTARLQHLIDLSAASQKFLLPEGGRMIVDYGLKALDDDVELRLPHKFVALEWSVGGGNVEHGESACPKRILFAREGDDGVIRCTAVVWWSDVGMWLPLPADFGIPMAAPLRAPNTQGMRGINVVFDRPPAERGPDSDYEDEAGCLLQFLNVLACSNVRTEKLQPSKTRLAMQAGKKGALPFDTYHVLTIEAPDIGGRGAATGAHRSPREHLRRGHIRRLADGRRIWVNATVVAAGRGAGVVSKDYAVRA